MADDKTLTIVLRSISDCYGDLDNPDFSFVQHRYRTLQRHDIICDALQICHMKNITDLNCHAALHLHMMHETGNAVACLSFVSKWAALFRLAKENELYTSVLDPSCGHASPFEREILTLMNSHGFTVLAKPVLSSPIGMSLPSTDMSDSMVYHAIISDDGIIPEILR